MSDKQTTLKGWKGLLADDFGLLSSPSQRHDWTPRVATTAYCGRDHSLRGESPAETCSCGIYAATHPSVAASYIRHHSGGKYFGVMAQIAVWGDWVVEGNEGLRGHRAYPLVVYCPAEFPDAWLEKYSTNYTVPFIKLTNEDWVKLTQIPHTKDYTPTWKQVDLSKYSSAEIARALRNKRAHQLYMLIRNREKQLRQLEALYRGLPKRIAVLKQEITEARTERSGLMRKGVIG